MGKESAPAAPDYASLARAQGAEQQKLLAQQTQANRPNQIGPGGSVTWSKDDAGNWTQQTTLAPNQQRAFDAQAQVTADRSGLANQLMQRVGESLSRPFDFSGMPAAGTAPTARNVAVPGNLNGQIGGAGQYTSQAGDALFKQLQSRLDPKWSQGEDALRSRLTNQGFTEGTEGWDKAMANFGRDRNDAYSTAALQAAQLAGQEGQRMQGMDLTSRNLNNSVAQQGFDMQRQAGNDFFGQQLQAGTFQNQLRQQAISDALRERGLALNDVNSLLQGTNTQSNPNFQNFVAAGQGQAADQMSAAQQTYGANLNAFNAGQAQNAQNMQLLGTAASIAPFFLSDRRVKRVIGRVGKTARGTPLYLYQKDGCTQMGVLAQEAPAHATRVRPDGLLEVNYAEV